jgi:DNA-binding PadR family transcriptional regulator
VRLGEWACLGVLYDEPAHGWAVARRLATDGDIGRVWHLSRPLTYRSLDALRDEGLVRPIDEEPGDRGPNRTILAATRSGRARFRGWVAEPVEHLRDLRSELLLKLVFAELHSIDVADMLAAQQIIVDERVAALAPHGGDVVARWRYESSRAAQRFVRDIR